MIYSVKSCRHVQYYHSCDFFPFHAPEYVIGHLLLVMFQYRIFSCRQIGSLGGVDVPCSAHQIVPGLLALLILRERVSCLLDNSSSLVGQVPSFSVMVLQRTFSTLHRNKHC